MSNSKQEAAAREKERELDKEQKLRKDSRRNSVLPKDLDTLDDSDFFSRSSTSGFGSDLSRRETLQLLGEIWWTNFTLMKSRFLLGFYFCCFELKDTWQSGVKWLWTNHHLAIKVFNVYPFIIFPLESERLQTKTIIVRRGLFRHQPGFGKTKMDWKLFLCLARYDFWTKQYLDQVPKDILTAPFFRNLFENLKVKIWNLKIWNLKIWNLKNENWIRCQKTFRRLLPSQLV